MANYFSNIFAKLNLERSYSIIEKNISSVLCLKYLEKYNCAWMNQINSYISLQKYGNIPYNGIKLIIM